MEWLRVHPYTLAVTAALLLLAAGVFVVGRSAPARSASQTMTWGGSGSATNPIFSGSAAQSGQSIMQQVQNTAPYTYVLPLPISDAPEGTEPGTSFDFDAFLSMLSGSSASGKPAQTTSSSGSADIGSAYAFIPSGLISTSVPTPSRTPTQKALYEYGNEVGSSIQSFEAGHTNEAQVLKDQAEDRTDQGKAAALAKLGNDFSGLGKTLLATEVVPSGASFAHKALGQAYVEMGGKLAQVPAAQGDSAFLTAIGAYNASVEVFVTRYVALAQIFASYGVTFAESDPGSVFSFTPAGF